LYKFQKQINDKMMSMAIELVSYVDQGGVLSGETAEKYAAHNAQTKLHLAFSCYVFDEFGRFLVTKRASCKKVWPNVWTNSFCGHPAPGETFEQAIVRRADYELGIKVTGIKCILPVYTYKTPPYNGIVEHEFCPIFVAQLDSNIAPNPIEIDGYEWLTWDQYVSQTAIDGDDYIDPFAQNAPKWSWWCKDQLRHIADNPDIVNLIQK
jgi:isopentenyl-diphosphate Delta-isomerase